MKKWLASRKNRLRDTALPLALFAVFAAVFIGYYALRYNASNGGAPVITFADAEIYAKVDCTAEDLLSGVEASDPEDGQLTGSVILESVSDLIDFDSGTCIVKYAVCDSDNNVTKASRELHYTNYTHPRFALTDEFRCRAASVSPDLLAYVSASDCIEGDISGNIKYSAESAGFYRDAGVWDVAFTVSSDAGDTVSLTLPLTVYSSSDTSARLTLDTYLLYRGVGEPFNAAIHVTGIKGSDSAVDVYKCVVSRPSDLDEAGVHSVKITLAAKDSPTGYEAEAILIVVTEAENDA